MWSSFVTDWQHNAVRLNKIVKISSRNMKRKFNYSYDLIAALVLMSLLICKHSNQPIKSFKFNIPRQCCMPTIKQYNIPDHNKIIIFEIF